MNKQLDSAVFYTLVMTFTLALCGLFIVVDGREQVKIIEVKEITCKYN